MDKIDIYVEILKNTQVFNSSLVNNIKDLYIDKAYKKNRLVMHTYNNEKKNLVLMHLPKIPRVNQSISSCFAVII